jgi:chromosome segregation ATPase
MIESSMYFAIGFLLAALSVLVVAPLVHGRAVRLTKRQLEATIPLSMAEVHADKDLLRAEFAMSTRRLEMNVEQLKTKSAGQLAELGRKGDAINRLKIELGALRGRFTSTEEEFAVKAAAVHEGERVLSDKESQLAKLMGQLDERSSLAEAQKTEIIALKIQVEAMKERLEGASNELKAVEDNRDAERALSDKESQLARLMGELDERSSLAEAQKTEIIALKTQIEAMKERLDGASNELKAVEDNRDAERIELKAATQKLMDERGKFENFHRRVTELVQQLMAQSTEDKILGRRAQELEKRLVVQSRLLNERESELEHLRSEIEIARKAEADLRIAMIEIDGRENAATQNLKAENAKLQAALDRANGERMRLAYELANMRRQVEEPCAAERVENAMPRERINDVAAGGAGRVAYGRLPRRANSASLTLVTSHEDRGVH